MNEELLPCPFCGTTEIKIEPWHGGGPYKHLVSCCFDGVGCDVGPSVTGETRALAIAAWNRRAPLSTQPETEPAPTGPIPADAATPTSLFIALGRIHELERELTQALKERDEERESHTETEMARVSALRRWDDADKDATALSAQLAAVTQERDNLYAELAALRAKGAK